MSHFPVDPLSSWVYDGGVSMSIEVLESKTLELRHSAEGRRALDMACSYGFDSALDLFSAAFVAHPDKVFTSEEMLDCVEAVRAEGVK